MLMLWLLLLLLLLLRWGCCCFCSSCSLMYTYSALRVSTYFSSFRACYCSSWPVGLDVAVPATHAERGQ